MAERPHAAAKFMATVSSPAGIYDYLLGGVNHSEADRVAAEKALEIVPETRIAALDNRAFLQRAVRYVAEHGVRQFIDLGSGYPTVGAVHEIASEYFEDPHVVYVDYDPAVARLSRRLLTSPHTRVVVHDLRRPLEIVSDPEVTQLIDWTEPVAVLMVAILHFVAVEDNPALLIATFRELMAAGSYLVVSHVSVGERPERAEDAAKAWDRARSPITIRTAEEIGELLAGFELIPPGLVSTREWRTTESQPPAQGLVLAGVGRLPGQQAGTTVV
ncbi:MAG TPA: SAM-dependent methyltransferase [Streptosporangiaceae bacterium]|nr:SAM-dependent methyltransferase [Streptosporangiaceae bacterium]